MYIGLGWNTRRVSKCPIQLKIIYYNLQDKITPTQTTFKTQAEQYKLNKTRVISGCQAT
jgi:hypothetical protein